MTTDPHPTALDVLIAGGGVAALETMMALRALAGDRVAITLLAPERDFRYRPMTVAEPFTIDHAPRLELAAVAAEFDARVVSGALAAVEPDECRVVTRAGERIGYDVLVIACGTSVRPALEGAVTIDDRTLGATLHGLVQDVEGGYVGEIAFVAAADAYWPLPLFELALMTAHRAYDMNVELDISIVSPEAAPLARLGTGIAEGLARLLADAGIAFHGRSTADYAHGELTVRPSGVRTRPGRVVALPHLYGPALPGIEADPHGFIAVSELGEVHGADGVYAVGDATAYPIKHGAIAAQQADIAAAAIAARAGADVRPQPLRPLIRGMLLTGGETQFLEARLVGDGEFASTMSPVCPWDAPAKIAARYLGAYLTAAERPLVGA